MRIKSSLGLAGALAVTLSLLPGCLFTASEGACRCSDPPGYCNDSQNAKDLCAQFSYCHYDEGDSCDLLAGGPPT